MNSQLRYHNMTGHVSVALACVSRRLWSTPTVKSALESGLLPHTSRPALCVQLCLCWSFVSFSSHLSLEARRQPGSLRTSGAARLFPTGPKIWNKEIAAEGGERSPSSLWFTAFSLSLSQDVASQSLKRTLDIWSSWLSYFFHYEQNSAAEWLFTGSSKKNLSRSLIGMLHGVCGHA